jgi:hypothetical protein
MKKYIQKRLKNLPKGELLECISAFNGFAIYRTNKFIDCEYYGKPRIDLISEENIKLNEDALNSPVLFDTPQRNNEDCEHRFFHFQAIQKNNARIRISPEILF